MVKCGVVLFEAWAEFLSTFQTSFGIKGIISFNQHKMYKLGLEMYFAEC
jgi:hypothetical protein